MAHCLDMPRIGDAVKITTVRTTANNCPDVSTCPSVELVDQHPDRIYLVGSLESDPAVIAAFHGRGGPGEALFWQPASLHPRAAGMIRLGLQELGEELSGYRERIFRLETLPAYAVTSDGDDFHRWVAGKAEPTWERKRPWLETLRAERRAGKLRSRVRILSDGLTEYERYACA